MAAYNEHISFCSWLDPSASGGKFTSRRRVVAHVRALAVRGTEPVDIDSVALYDLDVLPV